MRPNQDLSKLAQVLARMQAIQALHTGCSMKSNLIRDDDSCVEVSLRDGRLDSLLWTLYMEAFDEMHRRFAKPLEEALKSLGDK